MVVGVTDREEAINVVPEVVEVAEDAVNLVPLTIRDLLGDLVETPGTGMCV